MARGALGRSPVLAIATGLLAGRVTEENRARSLQEETERLMAPVRAKRQRQEAARTQLSTFDPTLADEQFDETRDYEDELNARRQLRRRAMAYRTVNPSVSLEEAEALMLVGPNARPTPERKAPVQYDSTRGGYFDPNSRTFTPLPELPTRQGTSTPSVPGPVNWQRVVREDGTIVQVHPRTGEVRPVVDANGQPLRTPPNAAQAGRDALREALTGRRGGAPAAASTPAPAAAPAAGASSLPPLSAQEKARARRDSIYRRLLLEEGYTDADWASAPAAPPGR